MKQNIDTQHKLLTEAAWTDIPGLFVYWTLSDYIGFLNKEDAQEFLDDFFDKIFNESLYALDYPDSELSVILDAFIDHIEMDEEGLVDLIQDDTESYALRKAAIQKLFDEEVRDIQEMIANADK